MDADGTTSSTPSDKVDNGLPGGDDVEKQEQPRNNSGDDLQGQFSSAVVIERLSQLKVFVINYFDALVLQIEKGLVEYMSSLKVFLVSCFYAVLLPNIINHKDAPHDAYVIIFTAFLGLCFSVMFLNYPCSPPKFGHRVKMIERYITISCIYACFAILAYIPCLVIFLRENIYAFFVLCPISIIVLIFTSLPKEDNIMTANKANGSVANLLSLTYSNNVLSVGAIVVVFLCSSMIKYPSTSAYSLELDLSLVLFFNSNMFGLTAILNILFPLMRNCVPTAPRITITKYLISLSSFLLVTAEICFASTMMEGYKLFLLATPIPSVAYVAVEWKSISSHAGTDHTMAPAGDVCKEFNTFVTLNFGVLMAVLQAYATSTWSFKESTFHLFVILSLIVLFSLQFTMLLAILMPPEEEGMMNKYMLTIIMGLLQVVAIGCLGLACKGYFLFLIIAVNVTLHAGTYFCINYVDNVLNSNFVGESSSFLKFNNVLRS